MNIELEKINNSYIGKFQREKKKFLQKLDKSLEVIEITFKDIWFNAIDDIQEYRKNAIKEFKQLEEKKGLCVPISYSMLPVIVFYLQEEYAYLTFGKILNGNNDIFNVGTKDDYHKMIEKTKEYGNKIHAWITTASGNIIDLTIKENIVFGSPVSIYNKYNYIYEPYEVYDCSVLDNIQNIDKAFKGNIQIITKGFKVS